MCHVKKTIEKYWINSISIKWRGVSCALELLLLLLEQLITKSREEREQNILYMYSHGTLALFIVLMYIVFYDEDDDDETILEDGWCCCIYIPWSSKLNNSCIVLHTVLSIKLSSKCIWKIQYDSFVKMFLCCLWF